MQNLSEVTRYNQLFGSEPDLNVLTFSYAPQSTLEAYRKGNSTIGFCSNITFFSALKRAASITAITVQTLVSSIFKSLSFSSESAFIANKATLFFAVRMMEAAFGILIIPFNNQVGSYFVDEARYNLQVYMVVMNHLIELLEKPANEGL